MKVAPPGILPLVSVDRASPVPLYQQVYQGYRDAIVDRRLRAGQRLPSTRSLAAELQISRIPILNAFEQLFAEGYVEGRVGAGTFVARTLPDDAPPFEADAREPARTTGRGRGEARPGTRGASSSSSSSTSTAAGTSTATSVSTWKSTATATPSGGTRASGGADTQPQHGAQANRAASARGGSGGGPRTVSRHPAVTRAKRVEPWFAGWGAFRMNQPAVDLFPQQPWSKALLRHARHPDPRLLRYSGPMGLRAFREAIAGYLRTARAVRCDADQIMVVSGSQQALEITSRVLIDADSPVWMEEPGYSGARDALLGVGARVVSVPVDAEGLDVARGLALCADARAAYVTPSHQYPLGMTMSATRRLQLLDWAQRAGAWIIEDDYDSEFRYGTQPVAALQGLDRDARVTYIGTFSKVLFPSIRLGYIVIPPDLVEHFAAVRESMDICAPALPQAVLGTFIEEGHFARHVRRMRQLYRDRRGALVSALGDRFGTSLRVLGDQAGMHLVATFAGPLANVRDRTIAERAAASGLWAMPLSICYFAKPARQGLVLGYGGTSVEEIPDGVQRLGAVVDEVVASGTAAGRGHEIGAPPAVRTPARN